MAKLPFMQFYPADWLQDTQILSLEAQGAWIKILCALHIASERGRKTWLVRDLKQFLGYPDDDRALYLVNILAEVADVEARDEDENVCGILSAEEITITSRRMVRDEIKRIQELERKRTYEKKNPKRHRQSSDTDPTRIYQKSEVRDHISEEDKEPPLTPQSESAQPDGFAEFWDLYPKKIGKGDAEKAWRKLRPSMGLREVMQKAIEEQKQSEMWTKERGQYIPLPATWLRGRRWDDELIRSQSNESELSERTQRILKRGL